MDIFYTIGVSVWYSPISHRFQEGKKNISKSIQDFPLLLPRRVIKTDAARTATSPKQEMRQQFLTLIVYCRQILYTRMNGKVFGIGGKLLRESPVPLGFITSIIFERMLIYDKWLP